ncbi:MAG TPA: hypothetical protein DEB42_08425 [Jeotgalicoccus sp.]|nr:hypothetical protein [Jeotgalicoccus sp.]
MDNRNVICLIKGAEMIKVAFVRVILLIKNLKCMISPAEVNDLSPNHINSATTRDKSSDLSPKAV